MNLRFTLFALLAVVCVSPARPVRAWTYKDLVAESDVVVIATPTGTRDKEKTVFPDMYRIDKDGQRVKLPALGVETTFEPLAFLKGEDKGKTFTLYHLRETEPSVPNGPVVASFPLKGVKRYLLFLKRGRDGRYTSVTGQVDSATGVKELGSHP
jgi:hypothetical protein